MQFHSFIFRASVNAKVGKAAIQIQATQNIIKKITSFDDTDEGEEVDEVGSDGEVKENEIDKEEEKEKEISVYSEPKAPTEPEIEYTECGVQTDKIPKPKTVNIKTQTTPKTQNTPAVTSKGKSPYHQHRPPTQSLTPFIPKTHCANGAIT